jgi:hypothetical protein
MMAARQFKEEGFLRLKFLWVPQGWASVSSLLDHPEIRHHAHGSLPRTAGAFPYRIYTHWPSWYSVPYGVLSKLGLHHKSLFQIWALSISLLSTLFLYLALSQLVPAGLALLATGLYVLSPLFIEYADSLANMPYDDLFRFSFLYFWIRSEQTRFFIASWVSYLLLSLTSLDSLFYVPVFALLYDILIRKEFPKGSRVKRWALLATAPCLGLGIQFIQNASYMGIAEAARDWASCFLGYTGVEKINYAIPSRSWLIPWMLTSTFTSKFLIPIPFIAFWLRKSSKERKLLIILFLCGIVWPLIVPGRSYYPHQGRHFLPFVGLSFAMVFFGLGDLLTSPRLKRALGGAALLLLLGHFYHFNWESIKYNLGLSNIEINRQLSFLQQVAKKIPGDKVYLELNSPLKTLKHLYPDKKGRFAKQADPLYEYYSEGLFLSVTTPEMAQEDLSFLWNQKPNTFTPIALVENAAVEKTLTALAKASPSFCGDLLAAQGGVAAVKLYPCKRKL